MNIYDLKEMGIMRFSDGYGKLGLFGDKKEVSEVNFEYKAKDGSVRLIRQAQLDRINENEPTDPGEAPVLDFAVEGPVVEEYADSPADPTKITPKERKALSMALEGVIGQTYYRDVPCSEIVSELEVVDGGKFEISFNPPCRGNPAFVGDIDPKVTGAPTNGTYRGTIVRKFTGDEIENAMVIVTWQYEETRGPGRAYEVLGYIS